MVLQTTEGGLLLFVTPDLNLHLALATQGRTKQATPVASLVDSLVRSFLPSSFLFSFYFSSGEEFFILHSNAKDRIINKTQKHKPSCKKDVDSIRT